MEQRPGDAVELELKRAGERVTKKVDLGGRPLFPSVPEGRLRTMRQMGGPISLVGNNFPVVIQTDMQLKPNECGGPVVDLDGNVIGLTISRTDRTRSFIIPSAEIAGILGQKPIEPSLAQLESGASRPPRAIPVPESEGRRPPRAVPLKPGAAVQLRNHLEEMADLLQMMDSEMRKIGE